MASKRIQQLRKLTRMPPREILGRLSAKVHLARERRAWKRGGNDSERVSATIAKVRPTILRDAPEAYRQLAKQCPSMWEGTADSCVANAQAISTAAWPMLGFNFDLTGDIDWHRDPRTDFRWPREFYADLPLYSLPDGVDFKYIWELGRQQYVVELARGWLFTGEDAFADRARRIMLSWIEANSLYEGIHWTSGLEVAMRSISWLWTLETMSNWSGWQVEERAAISASLADHANYLEHHFSFYSSPYNHLIGEATALLLIGFALDDHPDSDRWIRRGRNVLLEHGPVQFYSDGFCVEQATGYHYYTLGFLTMALVAARHRGDPLTELDSIVHRAYRAGIAFRQPNGRWPAIGDVDSARSIPVHHKDFWQFDSLSNLGAVLFDDAQLKITESGSGEELFWMLGANGITAWKALEGDRARTTLTELPDSGYAIASDGNDWLLLDGGPIAAGLHTDATPSVAHGHADTLQVMYVKDRQPLLSDSGMPFYGGDPDWVDYFRSSAAHNTLEVEGAELVRNAGRLAWSHIAPRPALHTQFKDNVWLASATTEPIVGVTIERHLLCLPGESLWIADFIRTNQPRWVTWHWQLPASAKKIHSDASHDVLLDDDSSSRLAIRATIEDLQSQLVTANAPQPVGFQCDGYGSWSAGAYLTARQQVEGVALVVSAIGSSRRSANCELHGQSIAADVADTNVERTRFHLNGATWSVDSDASTSETCATCVCEKGDRPSS